MPNENGLRAVTAEPLAVNVEYPDGRVETHEVEAGQRLVIGREGDCDVLLPYDTVTKKHLEIRVEEGAYYIRDLTSMNGTYLNGNKVVPELDCQVKPGDVVRIADAKLTIGSLPPATVIQPAQPALPDDLIELMRRLHKELIERIDLPAEVQKKHSKDQLHEKARRTITSLVEQLPSSELPSSVSRPVLVSKLVHAILGLGPLEELMSDPSITEIMVNGPDTIFVEREGHISPVPLRFMSQQLLLDVIERILAPLGKAVTLKTPMADARLEDGSRVNVVISPVSSRLGPVVTIRRFPERMFGVDDLIRKGTMPQTLADFLGTCVTARKNLVVSGGTGSGKTTLLNVLSNFIPTSERIVTIEDTAELRLQKPHVVPLEARVAGMEGTGEIMIRDLVRNALRMRPDRIIVGECRGAEALDMLQAMNTGHDGSLTTVHANGPRDAISRLETMVMMCGFDLPIAAIRQQIASAVDIIVQEARFASDGSRKITHVTEVTGMEGDQICTQDIFLFERTGTGADGSVLGGFVSTGVVPTFLEALRASGANVSFDPFGGGPAV